MDEAITTWRKAIDLNPRDTQSLYNLGMVYQSRGQLDEALSNLRQAVRFAPDDASAHGVLGQVLLNKGQYKEAREATARALKLLPTQHPMHAFATRQLQICEKFEALEQRLPRFQKGEEKPESAREALDIVRVCRVRRLHAAAVRFTAEAFSMEPKLADDPRAGHRYRGASSAVLAASGQAEDAGKLDEKERAALRKRALDWLRADLTALGKLQQDGPPPARVYVATQLTRWQKDSELASVRDKEKLEKLPAVEEKSFMQFWSDVQALSKHGEPAPGKVKQP